MTDSTDNTAHKRRLPRTFAALRHRNYRLFFGGQLISLIGTWMQQLALAWLVYQLTDSALLLGVISGIGSLPMLLFAVPGGVLADRKSKRRIILATQASLMVLAFALSALVAGGWIRAWHVAVLSALSGIVMAFDLPARQAFVIEMVGEEELMNAIALNSSLFNSARILGPAIAGLLIAKLGMAWCFFLNGFSFLAVITGLLLMRFAPREITARTGGIWEEAIGGLNYLRASRRLLGLVGLLGIFSIFGWSYNTILPVFARDILHSDARGLGALMTSNGAGALAGALLIASLGHYPHRARLLFGGGFLFCAAILAFSFSRLLPLSALLLAVAGVGGISLSATANTLIQTTAPNELRGRIMGLWALVFAGSTPLGSFQIGTLAHYLTAPVAVLIGGLISAGAISGAFVVYRRARGKDEG